MKKLLFVFVLSTLLFTYGCSKKTVNTDVDTTTEVTTEDTAVDTTADTETTEVEEVIEETTTSNTEGIIGVEACDRYLGFLQCIMEKMPVGADIYKEQFDQVKAEWMQEEDKNALAQGCEMIINVMKEQEANFEQLGCSL